MEKGCTDVAWIVRGRVSMGNMKFTECPILRHLRVMSFRTCLLNCELLYPA